MGRKPKIKEPEFSPTENDTSKQPLGDKAEKIENLIDEYKDIQEPKKERKQRVKKDDVKEAENFAVLANIQASIALEIIISRMPGASPLTEQERLSFDKAFTELVKKYYDSMAKFGVEVQFSLALILIILPRIDFKKIIDDRKNKNNIRQDRNRQDIANEITDSREQFKEDSNS